MLDAEGRVLAEAVLSQQAEHAPFGGVVPEVAARAHLVHLPGMVADVLARAGVGAAELSGVGASTGPGLIGGLIVGSGFGKGMALALGAAVRGGQSSGGACADGPAAGVGAGRGGVPVLAAAAVGGALPVRGGGRGWGGIGGWAGRSTTRWGRRSTKVGQAAGPRLARGPGAGAAGGGG